jgi:Zn-dependent protease with chaperone function
MATNFFQQQDTARRKTFHLLVLFGLSVAVLVLLVYLLCLGTFLWVDKDNDEPISVWHPQMFLGVVAVVSLVLTVGSLLKIAELASGGKAVALMVGGVEIQTNTRDVYQRRVLNVVEEMAIASGVPVPVVYLLPEEKGINAFAAGYGTGDAVVAVSQGCLDYLTRDELQGVLGHEFSHILNGDMRLNIRLIGIVAGIVILSQIGLIIMNAAGRSSRSSSNSSSKDDRGQFFLLGLGLYLLGLIGLFLGNLIKAAVSRQREFLADASSVQFTRNPDGIGGALKKIGGLDKGPNIDNPQAGEASHMFFADALLAKRFTGLFATHPPLEERIRRVDPHWDGSFPRVKHVVADPDEAAGPKPARKPGFLPGLPNLPGLPGVSQVPILAGLDEGTPSAPSRSRELPGPLQDAAHEPFSARSLVYALLLDRQPAARQAQLDRLREHSEPAEFQETLRLLPLVEPLAEEARLPLLDQLLPALREMSQAQYHGFRSRVEMLATVDHRVSVFEYSLLCVLSRRLDESFGRQVRGRAQYSSIRALQPYVIQVLALLAWEGDENEAKAQAAFRAGLSAFLGQQAAVPLPPREQTNLRSFHAALRRCDQAVPKLKQRVIEGCAACILADRVVTPRESELFRAICAVLGVPVPPLQS